MTEIGQTTGVAGVATPPCLEYLDILVKEIAMARYMVLRGNINGQDRGPGGHGQLKKMLYVFNKGEVFDSSEIKISKEAIEIALRRGNIEQFKEHRGAKPVTPAPLV